MPRIRPLPEILVKKIAAGEVIERPASVVKELMENSVDAGATRVAVTVDDGGRSLIRVVDDGCGIGADELRLAVSPHATSKIAAEDDLFRIASMGFRGEALASIGAVSRLRIVSRPHEQNEGAEIVVEAEQVRTNRAAGCPPGCSVEVRDLFFNVPARRKFLRQGSTEMGHVTTQFARIALAHPKIAFDLVSRDRPVHRLPANAARRERIGQLHSRELGQSLIEFRRDETPLAIEGYATPPAGARSTTNWQFAFVNGRFIRDRFIQHAVREAYRGLIDPHRAAVVFLFLTIDPAEVDVNVHPTKIEVRWQNSNLVHSQVLSALREALQSANLTPSLETGRRFGGPPPDPQQQEQLRRAFVDEMRRSNFEAQATTTTRDHGFGAPVRSDRAPIASPSPGGGLDVWRSMYGRADDSAPPSPAQLEAIVPADRLPLGPVRGAIQLHNTYLVCETDDGMVIIDQHALHERVLYNQLVERITRGKLQSQRLLLPETIDAGQEEMALLESHADLFAQLGLELSPFGRDSIAIQALPSILKDTEAAKFVRDVLDALNEHGNQPHTEVIIHRILDMMACKAAVKAGDPLTPEEISSLVAQLDSVEKSSNCPHGRPTTLRLTVKDLERQFKRI